MKIKFRDIPGMALALIGLCFTHLAVIVGGEFTAKTVLDGMKQSK